MQDEINELAGEMDQNAVLPSEDDLETYRIVFELFDRDRSGFIDAHDLAAISVKLGKDPEEGKTVARMWLKSLISIYFSFWPNRRFRHKSRWPCLFWWIRPSFVGHATRWRGAGTGLLLAICVRWSGSCFNGPFCQRLSACGPKLWNGHCQPGSSEHK